MWVCAGRKTLTRIVLPLLGTYPVCLTSLLRLVDESECSDLAELNPLELEVLFELADATLDSLSLALNNLNLSNMEFFVEEL